jgi:hypothetical protein
MVHLLALRRSGLHSLKLVERGPGSVIAAADRAEIRLDIASKLPMLVRLTHPDNFSRTLSVARLR